MARAATAKKASPKVPPLEVEGEPIPCIVCGESAMWSTTPEHDENAPLIYACDEHLTRVLHRQYARVGSGVNVCKLEEAD